MKTLTTLITILFISFLSSPSWSETVSMDELVYRDSLYYKKFTDTPFTGEVSGKINGNMDINRKSGIPLNTSINMILSVSGQELKSNVTMTMSKK